MCQHTNVSSQCGPASNQVPSIAPDFGHTHIFQQGLKPALSTFTNRAVCGDLLASVSPLLSIELVKNHLVFCNGSINV